jgi:hypothetical protein
MQKLRKEQNLKVREPGQQRLKTQAQSTDITLTQDSEFVRHKKI